MFLPGIAAAYNYTYGPVLVYKGPRSIDEIYRSGEPVVVVARKIPHHELRRIELTRVRGFVFMEGDPTDERLLNFLMKENRAAVIGCAGILDHVADGQWVIVDGVNGAVCVDPTPEALAAFEEDRRKGPPKDMGTRVVALAQTLAQGLAGRKASATPPPEPPAQAPGPAPERLGPGQAAPPPPGLIERILAGLPLPARPPGGRPADPASER